MQSVPFLVQQPEDSGSVGSTILAIVIVLIVLGLVAGGIYYFAKNSTKFSGKQSGAKADFVHKMGKTGKPGYSPVT